MEWHKTFEQCSGEVGKILKSDVHCHIKRRPAASFCNQSSMIQVWKVTPWDVLDRFWAIITSPNLILESWISCFQTEHKWGTCIPSIFQKTYVARCVWIDYSTDDHLNTDLGFKHPSDLSDWGLFRLSLETWIQPHTIHGTGIFCLHEWSIFTGKCR